MGIRPETELFKALLALLWLPLACVVYAVAFGVGLLKVAAKEGWGEFK